MHLQVAILQKTLNICLQHFLGLLYNVVQESFLYRINLAPFVYREDYFTSYQNLATSIFSFVLSFFISNIWTFFSWLSGKKHFYNRYV